MPGGALAKRCPDAAAGGLMQVLPRFPRPSGVLLGNTLNLRIILVMSCALSGRPAGPVPREVRELLIMSFMVWALSRVPFRSPVTLSIFPAVMLNS